MGVFVIRGMTTVTTHW